MLRYVLMQSGMLDWYPFDPLSQRSESMETKEIKNGRYAAMLVYDMQPAISDSQSMCNDSQRAFHFLLVLSSLCFVQKTSFNQNCMPFNYVQLASGQVYTYAHRQQMFVSLCRLAMVAIVGFAVQALVTREQPVAGLTAHIADPFGHNIITCVLIYG